MTVAFPGFFSSIKLTCICMQHTALFMAVKMTISDENCGV